MRGALLIGTISLLNGALAAPAPSGATSLSGKAVPHTHAIPAAESGLLPWRLAAPISRTVALPGPDGRVVILGGLTSSNTSVSGVFTLDTGSGHLNLIGNLAAGLHDASGAVLNRQDVLFGGGSPATVATVQGFPAPQASGTAVIATATATGDLPRPRSDSSTTTIGRIAYIVGGYDGTNPDPAVLATRDGHTFTSVASLPTPVRYPAVASSGGLIYVFGGQAITGLNAGVPVSAIQVVDPRHHTAKVIGHLPIPLDGATAVTIGTQIYVAGGESTVAQPAVPGVGTTQLTPPPPGANRGAGANSATLSALDAAPATTTTSTIWAFDAQKHRMLTAGHLQVPISHSTSAVLGNTAWFVGGESSGSLVSTVQTLTPDVRFGTAGALGAGSPYFGMRLLIADRGNNRLLLMDAGMHITWTYPSATTPPDPYGFVFPDDAFFVNGGRAIISNQEENETIVEVAYPSGKIIWEYGHPKQPGTSQGFLHEPDDAYLLKNGQITVADAQNCRILVINHNSTVAGQIGTNGRCFHNPPSSMGSPNGDTPLANGNVLVSEINGSWVSEYTLSGRLVWTAHVPVSYPSDPQQLGADLYLVADYARPGAIIYTNRTGQVLYRYQATSGPGMLDHPSLAERLPSGVIMINDDYANRMVAIDPTTGALVWQYGITDSAGTSVGMLNTPDGFDLLTPDGSTPTHPTTG
ncbi:MAG TPA: PQQ-binding-like beta-propeller repeat protein [Acidimicrobiales bacterium]|nr:PQQ-binding-like beta-propeller repeat protein [Acidimicrobiales bacterium]